MEEQNDQLEKKGGFKKYWWVALSVFFVVIGISGIIYLSLMQSSEKTANKSATPTPTPTKTELQKIEEDEKAIDTEIAGVEKDLKEINESETYSRRMY